MKSPVEEAKEGWNVPPKQISVISRQARKKDVNYFAKIIKPKKCAFNFWCFVVNWLRQRIVFFLKKNM